MFHSSYADVFALPWESDAVDDIAPGDTVRCGANLFPHYEVIAVSGETAWLRDVSNGADHLAPLARCRKIARDQG